MLAFGTESVFHPVVNVVDVRLGIEPRLGAKAIAAIGVVRDVIQLATLPLHNHFGGRTGVVMSELADIVQWVAAKGRADHALKAGNPVGIEAKTAIDSADAIEVLADFTISKHDSEGRLIPDITAYPTYCEARVLVE